MKQTLTLAKVLGSIVFISAFTFFLHSCKQKGNFNHQKSDTSIRACIYMKDFSGNVYGGLARVFIKDSMKQYIDSSSGEQVIKKDWQRDTSFYFLVYDTIFDTKTKLPKKDTTGKVLVNPNFRLLIPNKYVSPTSIIVNP